MIQFSKLRLHGFKSFVEKTELEIGSGLTGIVGPNGCGKSNLVEALRWSMGENSSKRMRGGTGTMDDVIFSGTEQRPARNTAEVSILLDNASRTAPSPWNDGDEVEVVRKIEREEGSSYRVNGKHVRARDVQLFYADISCGAGSPFLISQGKATALIQAKPIDRRMVLEEAAGITGLYARRHEAELRLRATDNNLKRLEDLLAGMESRLNDLKKQARQATKYRNLSAQIRQLEVMIASLEWKRAHERLLDVQRVFGEAESAVADRLTTVSQLNKTQNAQAQDLPPLRQQDAEIAARLQTQKIALQRLEDESARLSAQLQEAKTQLEQALHDRGHEQQTLKENTEILEKLESEEKDLLSGQEREEEILKQREETRAEQQGAVENLESGYTALMEQNAADRARKQSLEQQTQQDSARREALSSKLQSLKDQLAAKKADAGGDNAIQALRDGVEALEKAADTLRDKVLVLESDVESARKSREETRQERQEAENRKAKLDAEIETLESIVRTYSGEGFRPVLDDIHTDEGFELALSRALGDTLMASSDSAAPVIWQLRRSMDVSSLPAGAESLTPRVRAPEVLKLALSQIGIVGGEEEGDRLAAHLKPGQTLVSREGGLWRWDGLTVRMAASDRHAVQLQQKNRLDELLRKAPDIESSLAALREKQGAAEKTLADAQAKLSEKQKSLQASDADLRTKRIDLTKTIEAQAARQAELAKLEEALTLVDADLTAIEEKLENNALTLKEFDDARFAAQQEKIDAARERLAAARDRLHEAIKDFEISRQENSRRKARLHAIADERVNLQNRCIRARERIRELDGREEQLKEKIAEFQGRPGAIREERERLLSRIGEIEQEKAAVSDRLTALEGELADTTKALKEAESLLSEARETRAHAQATTSERQNHMDEIRSFIRENFNNMTPEELSTEAAISDEAMPDLDDLKQKKEKSARDRDLIGAVNLRADQEVEDLEKQLGGIISEKNDLASAIEELRQGIEKLNGEARERLNTAFTRVNDHFRELFTRLFNGGKAHLALIEADDPLEAGLEIFAQPPGKALQSLSLLSGGEQSLTAIALIFAIFLTNPAPICVLDEVDAPLDDANVDRFCDLLEEFADKGETRFLVITHHRMTMARMDRLYGVTMSERGVSQLVSVDLNQQLDFLEAAA